MSKKPIPPPFTVTTKPVATPSTDLLTVDLVSKAEPSCGTCACWRLFGNVGHCHRYPATVRKDATSFCWEFKPK